MRCMVFIFLIGTFPAIAYGGVASFNCTALGTRADINTDLIEFSIRGCTDDVTNELAHCSLSRGEPKLIVARTVIQVRNGVRERMMTKTFEVPKSMIAEFQLVVQRLKIRIKNQQLDLGHGDGSLSYLGKIARPGDLYFANFSNSTTKKMMFVNFGTYMAIRAKDSVSCTFAP